jgi:hypothetical protein
LNQPSIMMVMDVLVGHVQQFIFSDTSSTHAQNAAHLDDRKFLVVSQVPLSFSSYQTTDLFIVFLVTTSDAKLYICLPNRSFLALHFEDITIL